MTLRVSVVGAGPAGFAVAAVLLADNKLHASCTRRSSTSIVLACQTACCKAGQLPERNAWAVSSIRKVKDGSGFAKIRAPVTSGAEHFGSP